MDSRLNRSADTALQRLLFGAALAAASALTAWFVVSLMTARYLVPAQSGLAGAATVVVSGLAAAFVAIVAATITAWRASLRTVTTATIIALAFGIGAASLLQTMTGEPQPEELGSPGSSTQLPLME